MDDRKNLTAKPDGQAMAGRMAWMAMVVALGVGLSLFFACATPFAALAALAALKAERRDAAGVVGLTWAGNQAVGYGCLGYPWAWDSVAWGLAIGLSAALALLAAVALVPRRPASFAISLPFIGAFAAYELGLYIASFVLPGSDAAFAPAIVKQLFLVNLMAFLGLVVAHQVASLIGLTARQHGGNMAGATASLH